MLPSSRRSKCGRWGREITFGDVSLRVVADGEGGATISSSAISAEIEDDAKLEEPSMDICQDE